jgi:hypothetical protein
MYRCGAQGARESAIRENKGSRSFFPETSDVIPVDSIEIEQTFRSARSAERKVGMRLWQKKSRQDKLSGAKPDKEPSNSPQRAQNKPVDAGRWGTLPGLPELLPRVRNFCISIEPSGAS